MYPVFAFLRNRPLTEETGTWARLTRTSISMTPDGPSTIQFLPPRVRQTLIDSIYTSLNWGGAFFMFEKVRAPDSRFQDYANQTYIEFKLDNGFSEAEIINKARSIKGVMEPFSSQGNIDMLRRAGFTDIVTIQKYVCFEGFLAIK